jgi:hypothetical protein
MPETAMWPKTMARAVPDMARGSRALGCLRIERFDTG